MGNAKTPATVKTPDEVGKVIHQGEHVVYTGSPGGGKVSFSGPGVAVIIFPGGLYEFTALNIEDSINIAKIPENVTEFSFSPNIETVEVARMAGFVSSMFSPVSYNKTTPKKREHRVVDLTSGRYTISARHDCEVSWAQLG